MSNTNREEIIRALSAVSQSLRKAHEIALQAGDKPLADHLFEEGVRVLKLIGKVATRRPLEAFAS